MLPNLFNIAMLALEAQEVIFLRTLKLSAGGSAATTEAVRMVTEKVFAAQEATMKVMTGASADRIVTGYRSKVRANARRLGSTRRRGKSTKA
jgi:hypothetical protein